MTGGGGVWSMKGPTPCGQDEAISSPRGQQRTFDVDGLGCDGAAIQENCGSKAIGLARGRIEGGNRGRQARSAGKRGTGNLRLKTIENNYAMCHEVDDEIIQLVIHLVIF